MNSELENIGLEIRRLQRKAISIRENLKPLHYEINDSPLIKFRANSLKITPVKKVVKINKQNKQQMSKHKVTTEPGKVARTIVAAQYAEMQVLGTESISPKKVAVILSGTANQLLEAGGYIETLTDAEIKAKVDADKKAAEEKAAKEKALKK